MRRCDPVYQEITAFAARGNFLNWAAASKLDIQKKVLTGGKYDDTNDELILESRGCLNHRYVKKIGVQNFAASPSISPWASTGPLTWKNGTVYPAHSVVGTTLTTPHRLLHGYYTSGGRYVQWHQSGG